MQLFEIQTLPCIQEFSALFDKVSNSYTNLLLQLCEPGSSVTIVSDYEKNDQGSITERDRGFFSPASWGKARPGRDADHPPPSNAGIKKSRDYTSSLLKRLHGV
jgi:hypothetical protein